MLVFSLLSTGPELQDRRTGPIPGPGPGAEQHHTACPGPAPLYLRSRATPHAGSYAGSICSCWLPAHYLPVWDAEQRFADPAFSFPRRPPCRASTIRYSAASNNAEAGRIAARLGAVARVSGNHVTVGFADPTDLALLDTFVTEQEDAEDEFVKRAGDEMSGVLSFSAGIGNAIDLNGNSLTDVLRISAIQDRCPDSRLRRDRASGHHYRLHRHLQRHTH